MGLAMVPLRRLVAGFPQLVRELAAPRTPADPVKDVALVLTGQDVELDTRVLDAVADALRHLVTNAVDHGCESPAERIQAGKPAAGDGHRLGPRRRVHRRDRGLRRRRAASTRQPCARSPIARGLLPADSAVTGAALLQVLFSPGFSTRDEITQTSGRGVGLDVVRTVVEDLSGTIEVRAEPGRGTTFTISLPVTLGVLRCLHRPGRHRALRAAGVRRGRDRSVWPTAERHEVAGVPVLARDGRTMPLVDLGRALGVPGDRDAARRRRGPARRRRRAAGPGRRRARGRARGRGQGARRLPRPAAHASPAPPSTATAPWCWCSTSASSPSASWPSGGGQAPASLRRAEPAYRRPRPPGRSPGRGCWSSRTRSGCASCSG